MATSISNIDEYIAQQDIQHQEKLQALRELILQYAPKETTEAYTYQMPTFRYKGNLIHFALNKQHIGIYPGPEAILEFQDDLNTYKTTKAAIQIPLDQPLPKALLKRIIAFNVTKKALSTGPNWHQSRGNWDEAEEIMQQIITTIPELEKAHKWGTDVYTYINKNVIAWGGFKNFFSLWFYNGVFLSDPRKVLITASKGKTKALRQWRFTSASEMDTNAIKQYIKESIQKIKDGKEISIEKGKITAPDPLWENTLKNDSKLATAFKQLTPGKQKDYNEYILDAKQEKTKQSRITKIIPLIILGVGLNDKYKK